MIKLTINPAASSKVIIEFQSKYNFYKILDVIKNISGAYRKDKVWKINVDDSKLLIDQLSLIDGESVHVDYRIFDSYVKVVNQKKGILELRNKLDGIDCGIKLKEPYALLPFQHIGVEFIHYIRNGIVADKVGLGKTLIGFSTAKRLHNEGKVNKCLVVIPSSMKKKWSRDIKKFLGEDVLIYQGMRDVKRNLHPTLVRKEKFNDFINDDKQFFCLISYDTLKQDWENIKDDIKENFIVIFDEIQKCKNPATQRSIICKELATLPLCYSRIGLSATYVETGMDNLFGVMLIIDENIFGNNYMNFANSFIEFDYMGKVEGFKNVDMAADKMKYVAIRRNKEQVQDQLNALLPKVNENTLWLDLTKEQKKLYNDVLDRVVEKITDMEKAGKISMANAMTELGYLRQVCLSTEMLEPTIKSSNKINSLLEILPEIIEENKVVIFCFYTKFVDIMERELTNAKIECMAMHGKRKEGLEKNRQDMIDKFSESKTCQVLITSDILKEGLDIPAASYVINTDILWNPAGIVQRNGRIDRLNQQKENIFVVNLWSPESIEEGMFDVVYERQELAKQIIDDGVVEQRHKKLSFKDIKHMLRMSGGKI